MTLIAASLSVAACSNQGQSGFTEVTQGRLQVAVPDGWVEGQASGVFDVIRQDKAGDSPDLRLAAASDYPDSSARGALGQLRMLNVLGTPDGSGGMSEVDGDPDFWRWDMTAEDGDFHATAWARCDRSSDHCVMVVLTGTQMLDTELSDTIQESVQVLPIAD